MTKTKLTTAAFWSLLAFCLLAAPSATSADAPPRFDISIAGGVSAGSISQPQKNAAARTFRIGGVPFAAALYRDLSEHWSSALQLQCVLDTLNQQIARQGLGATIFYHLLGGSRRLAGIDPQPEGLFTIESRSRYNLSLAIRAGLYSYAASSKDDPDETLSGGVGEVAVGLEYRHDVSPRNAFGASFMTSALSIPTSAKRLDSATNEFLIFWRFYL